jgi:hypothetical protein
MSTATKSLLCLVFAASSFDSLAVTPAAPPPAAAAQPAAPGTTLKLTFTTYNRLVDQPEDEVIVKPDLHCQVHSIRYGSRWILEISGTGHWDGNQFICVGPDVTDFSRSFSIRFPGGAAGVFPKVGTVSSYGLDQHLCGPVEVGAEGCRDSDLKSIKVEAQ